MATVQRHPDCGDVDCKVCLADAEALERELLERTGRQKRAIDILSSYRRYLLRNGIPADSDHGWPRPEVYDETNIAAYVAAITKTKEQGG